MKYWGESSMLGQTGWTWNPQHFSRAFWNKCATRKGEATSLSCDAWNASVTGSRNWSPSGSNR